MEDWEIINAECVDYMRRAAEEGVVVHAIVTDPPYHLSTVKRAARGFMGQEWDGGGVAFDPETWRACYDLLPPGGHLIAFGGSRTYHRMACAIEDAGFEIRDQIMWLYGTGFPKSHDVSKGIDKAAGAKREVVGTGKAGLGNSAVGGAVHEGGFKQGYNITAPATDAAKQWDGWGTALKPAHEPIVLARKPLDGTVAANVLAHGTGALNIGACRVPDLDKTLKEMPASFGPGKIYGKLDYDPDDTWQPSKDGRWPANVAHDSSEEVVGLLGEPARFFYSSKASKKDRAGSRHPTVKPVALMRWLVRMVTPPGGTVLDPFAGSGTTGEAALAEGMRCIMVEREEEYAADIVARMEHLETGAEHGK